MENAMIEIINAVIMLFLFAIWAIKDPFNAVLKFIFLACAIWLGIDTAIEMGYIIQLGEVK